jgi:hypothetical protein
MRLKPGNPRLPTIWSESGICRSPGADFDPQEHQKPPSGKIHLSIREKPMVSMTKQSIRLSQGNPRRSHQRLSAEKRGTLRAVSTLTLICPQPLRAANHCSVVVVSCSLQMGFWRRTAHVNRSGISEFLSASDHSRMFFPSFSIDGTQGGTLG